MKEINELNHPQDAGWIDILSNPEYQNQTFCEIHGQRHTYGSLLDAIRRLHSLFKEYGLQAGDRIVLSVRDDYSSALLFLAFLRYGMTTVLIDPDVPSERAQALIEKVQPRGLVMDTSLFSARRVEPNSKQFQLPVVAATQKKGNLFKKLLKSKPEPKSQEKTFPAILDQVEPDSQWPKMPPLDSLAYILFTSGTTAAPKGVMITHRNLHRHLGTMTKVYRLQEADRLLNILSLYHSDGLNQGPILAAFNRATWIKPLRFDISKIDNLFAAIYKHRINHFVVVPTILSFLNKLSDGHETSFQTDDFRSIISVASQLEPALWQEFESKFGVRIINVFGLTETVCGAIFSGLDETLRRVGTIGKPVDCEARIEVHDGSEANIGEVGELLLRGDNISPGYFQDEAATSAAYQDGWLRTGDQATRDADGFFQIVGRLKNVVNSGGFNIYPEQVTEAILTHPDMMQAITLGLPDDVFGEKIASAVVLRPTASLTEQQLTAYLRARLEANQVPAEIHFLDDLPRGLSGKVQLGETKKLLSEMSAPVVSTPPEFHFAIIATAAEVFKVPLEQLSLRDNSSTVEGWDSMAHLSFITSLEKRFNIRFSTGEIISMNSLANTERVLHRRLSK